MVGKAPCFPRSVWILLGYLCLAKFIMAIDYSSLIKSPSFMDRTILVKLFLEDKNYRILVAAPPRSGKTTNLHMIRQFLEISVDEIGNPEDIPSTSNYKLFNDNHLNIFEQKEFVQRHFGKYPVMFINLRTLGNVFTFKELVQEFREILREVFNQHKYLLFQKRLWCDRIELGHFKNLMDGKSTKYFNPGLLIKSLTFLTEVLHEHFGKKVIVLLDDYDALSVTSNVDLGSDKDQIILFFTKLYNTLLRTNKFVDRVLLTGVDKGVIGNTPELNAITLPNDVVCYEYIDDIPLCKYFRYKFP